MANPNVQEAVAQQLVSATQMMEQQLDAEIERLDKMDEDDFEMLRRKRLEALKKSQQQKQEWMTMGHGKYEEVPDEKAFFDACKKSKKVVCHFYRDSTPRCKIVDKHLEILAPKHVETRFIRIDAERSKFLVERLRIVVLPTICLARDGKTVDYIVGFDDMGGKDDFQTNVLEWRIGRADVINYSGDLTNFPGTGGGKKSVLGGPTNKPAKSIRERDDSDSEDDW